MAAPHSKASSSCCSTALCRFSADSQLSLLVSLSSAVGLCISLYALHVQRSLDGDHNFRPLCDVSAAVSCSKVLTSKFSHVTSLAGIVQEGAAMDFSNASLGLIFYSATFFLPAGWTISAGFLPSAHDWKLNHLGLLGLRARLHPQGPLPRLLPLLRHQHRHLRPRFSGFPPTRKSARN
eukprot:GHVT01001061.1.p1 GENE.GHVT01001061.1~~GHVT01001061.1.p1  ORF type:complete len:179 (+),score=22.23 GHVT01001061.1:179-715(+)